MKKLMLLIVTSLFMIGLTGCDLFGGEDVPDPCPEGFELQGTECVAITTGDAPVITLLGDATVTIAVGSTYTDAGATATDTEDGDLTNDIVVNNTVNVNTAGTYTVTYDVTDSDGNAATQVTRTVVVAQPGDNDPVLTLNGDTTITIAVGDTFTDPGASATDLEDGDLTASITTTGTVNADVAGSYEITYSITDSDNNTVSVTRTVVVTASEAEILANYIVDNWDGSLQFLGLTMANMDMSSAMTLNTEINFEVTEDIDETRYVTATITDQFVYAETGDTVHRMIDIDVDNEFQITVNIIFQEVDTGVHMYLEYRPIFDLIYQQNPEMIDTLGWVGFDNQWALFQLDDSLQNVIEVAVIKEMLDSLFFSEMGEYFFAYVQELQIEQAIGYDLNQYGVDMGAFVDLLIEQNWADAELMLQGIETDNIVLHADHMYLAWRLRELLLIYETELADAGFVMTQLDLLDTATMDEFGAVTLTKLTIDNKPDPMYGTQVFFEQMTDLQQDILFDFAIKPFIEENVLGTVVNDVAPDWLDQDLEAMLQDYQLFLEENWPQSSDPFVYADELAELQATNAQTYWQNLTQEEKDIFHWAIDHHYVGWSVWNLEEYMYNSYEFQPMLQRWGQEIDIYALESNLVGLLNDNVQYISDNYSQFDVNIWFTGLEDAENMFWWYHDLPQNEKDMLWDIYTRPEMSGYAGLLDEIMHYSERPWDYQFWYTSEYTTVGVNHVTWTVEELLWQYEPYLNTNYGYDVSALVDEIHSYDHKAVEWYLWHASYDNQMHLMEIASMTGEDHYMWTIYELEEIYYNDWEFYTFFGRSEEMYDFWYLNEEVDQLLWSYSDYLATNYPSVDIDGWLDAMWDMGLPIWWDTLSQTEKDIIDEISTLDDGWYRWPIELMLMRDTTPEEFHVGLCNWGWCLDEQGMTLDMIQLINNNTDFLTEKGYNPTDMIDAINNNGILYWYNDILSEQDYDILRQMADNSHWRYKVLDTLYRMSDQEQDFLDFLLMHETALTDMGFPATAAILSIETNGIQYYVQNVLTVAEIEILLDAYVYPKIEGLLDAIDTSEVPEYIVDVIMNDPHFDFLLDMIINEDYTYGWRAFVNDWEGSAGSLSVVDNQLVFDVTATAALNENWKLQVIQDAYALGYGEDNEGSFHFWGGQTYILRFDAKASVAGNINIAIGEMQNPNAWVPYHMEMVAITTEMTSYEITFTLDNPYTDYSIPAQLKFEMGLLFVGEDSGQFVLDNVEILEYSEYEDQYYDSWMVENGTFGPEGPHPLNILDLANLQSNMLAVDFDGLATEIDLLVEADYQAMYDAIYGGTTTFDTYLSGLQTTSPNLERILSLFGPAVQNLQPYIMYLDDFNYAMDGLSAFEQFSTMAYWLDDANMDMDLTVTPEFYIETGMTMNYIMYQTVVQDLFDQAYVYLSGFQTIPFPFDENWACVPNTDPNYDPYCDDLQISDLMSMLAQMGDIGMMITYDPSNATWMELEVSFTDFLDMFVSTRYDELSSEPGFTPSPDNDYLTGVTNATITITMSEGGTITLPDATVTNDVNALADEFGKFGIAMFARDYLRDLMWHYEYNPDDLNELILAGNATYSVNEFHPIRTSAAFDNDASEIAVVVDVVNGTVEFSLTLYWIDGTEALNGSVSMSDFDALFGADNELLGQTAYDTMKGFVNDTNYRLTKLWLMFLLQEDDHDDYNDDNGMYR